MWHQTWTIFLSIILESMPFVMIGVILSSLIQAFISEEKLLRFIPKKEKIAVVWASLLGLILPVCDCGVVPVTRSLLKKGMPIPAAMAFTLAAPVINPITMTSTYFAFGMNPRMMWIRVLSTFCISIFTGFMLVRTKTRPTTRNFTIVNHVTSVRRGNHISIKTLTHVLEHTINEFFEVGIFIVISAGVSAILQTLVPKTVISHIGQDPILSVFVMMILAIVFSLCSEADAFVARSLSSLTTPGSILSFLVIGQMIDLRNILMLPRIYRSRTIFITFISVLIMSWLIGYIINILPISL